MEKEALMTQEIKIVQEKLHGFWVGLRERERGGGLELVNDTQWWVTAGGSLCLPW